MYINWDRAVLDVGAAVSHVDVGFLLKMMMNGRTQIINAK
jgi:hypothetical protein